MLVGPTIGVFRVGPRCRPRPPAPPGDCIWQTVTFFRNPNVEPSSYPYTSTEGFSDIPTNFGLPPVRCSQWNEKNGYLDRLKRSRWYILLYKYQDRTSTFVFERIYGSRQTVRTCLCWVQKEKKLKKRSTEVDHIIDQFASLTTGKV